MENFKLSLLFIQNDLVIVIYWLSNLVKQYAAMARQCPFWKMCVCIVETKTILKTHFSLSDISVLT